MRVTQNLVYGTGLDSMRRGNERLLDLQQQLATGRRIVTPASDPVGAAQALRIDEDLAQNARYGQARGYAVESLTLTEAALGRAGDLLQSAATLAVQAGNGSLGDAERLHLAAQLDASIEELLAIANTRDAAGRYLFAGFQESVQPFLRAASGVTYQGDEGRRELQVDAARRMTVTENGSQAFERMRAGNGSFVTGASAANTGSGIITAGSVLSAPALTGDDYRIEFTVAGGVTTYAVANSTTATTLVTGVPYESGRAITFDGVQVEVEGTPASGDAFTVTPSASQSAFKTLERLAAALRAGTAGPGGGAKLASALNAATASLGQALDHLLGARASAGARLRELDALESAGEAKDAAYRQALSRVRDVDIASAISDLQREQLYLEAAQKSYVRIAGLSLFTYL